SFRPEGAEIEEEQRRTALAGEPPASPEKAAGNQLVASLRDAAIAGIIAFLLAAPLVGQKTIPGPGSRLTIEAHWQWVAIIVGVVFIGRLLLNLFVWKTEVPVTASLGRLFSADPMTQRDWSVVVVAAVILAALNFLPEAFLFVMSNVLGYDPAEFQAVTKLLPIVVLA